MGAGAICMYLIGGPASGRCSPTTSPQSRRPPTRPPDGIPLIVEATLWGSRHTDKKDAEAVQHMCRMAYELGADAIKTEYTGDVESMRQVISSVGVPVLTLGGARGASDAVEAAARTRSPPGPTD